MTLLPTFEVDKVGMAKVFARRGKAFVVTELLQNAYDEDTTHVDVIIERLTPTKVRLTVEDDNPDGFADLRHAYTLFAESAKKIDPEKRGRFNLGEKLVVAVCEDSMIETTKGTVVFTDKGRQMLRKKRAAGSKFTATLKMTKDEQAEVEAVVRTILPPAGITTTFNLTELAEREPLSVFAVTLRTEISDDEGRLKPTTRKTQVQVFDPLPGEVAGLYEMGIPVVDTDDRYHVNVMQKVPLNTDRDNVTPAYLQDVRTAVLNHMHSQLEADATREDWVTEALQDPDVLPEAVNSVLTGRYGEKRVIMDPTDMEANKIAVSEGYTVIPGGALPKLAWGNIKSSGAALPAGKVTPSPNPNEGAENLKLMEPEHYPDAVQQVVDFAKVLAEKLIGVTLDVQVAQATSWPFAATYGPPHASQAKLTLNYGRLGYGWFAGDLEPILDILFDEFGHYFTGDHLSREYYKGLRLLGARAVALALAEPSVFDLRAAVTA